ncbi:MAG: sigma-70 family RNA polymerase sigma factor [Candidatus Eremiobacteraeota bacterium]|nr:sigma-70 family RNA polymerase sigma factor [Candidatus Eremiobacteraeota bacterium]
MISRIEDTQFETFFAREYRGVVAAARRVVGVGAAEDIAQEAFAALYRTGPADPNHARNWVYRTTLHRAISLLRSEKRRQAREAGTPASVPEPAEQPQALLERRELSEAVQGVLRRLHHRYAVVLALRHSGMSYKEVAAVMDVNVNQVGTLLVRAESAFKRELDRVSHF